MSSAVGVSRQPLHPLPIAALLFPCSCRASERKSHKAEAKRSRAGAKEKTLECGQIVWGLAFSAWPAARHPDGAAGLCCQVLATGLNDGQIKVWEVQTGERLRGAGQAALCPRVEISALPFPKYSLSCCPKRSVGVRVTDVAALCRTSSLQPSGAPGCCQGPELCAQWEPHPGVGIAGQDPARLGPQQGW